MERPAFVSVGVMTAWRWGKPPEVPKGEVLAGSAIGGGVEGSWLELTTPGKGYFLKKQDKQSHRKLLRDQERGGREEGREEEREGME